MFAFRSPKNRLSCLALLAALLLIACSRADDDSIVRRLSPPPFDDVSAFGPSEAALVDEWLSAQREAADYPSLSAAIVRDGRVVYLGSFGFADREAARAATPETSYHAASLTKVFTTTLAALLDEQGILELDRPIGMYLPSGVDLSTTPERGKRITARMLASHTSGLPHPTSPEVQSIDGDIAAEHGPLYAYLRTVELRSYPGTEEHYSNLGMGLLGCAMENAADMPFETLLEKELFRPLGLSQSTLIVTEGQPSTTATGYGRSSPRRAEPHRFRGRLSAHGGLTTSAADLALFLLAQISDLTPGPLSSELRATLHAPTKLQDGTPARTALGWSVRGKRHLGRILEKSGNPSNAGAWMGFAPEHGVGVAVLTNCGAPAVDPLGRWLLERAVPGIDPTALDHTPVAESDQPDRAF